MEQAAWYSLQSATGIIIHLGAVVAALGGIFIWGRKLFRWLNRLRKRVMFVLDQEEIYDTIIDRLDCLTAQFNEQFNENGGNSATDKLDKLLQLMRQQNVRDNILDARIRATLHIHETPVFETDKDGLVTYVNQAYTRMAGLSAHELMGEGWINITNPETRDRDVEGWFRAVRGVRNYDGEVIFVRPDGTQYKVHVIANVIKDDEGNLVGHFGKVLVEE